MDTLGYSVTRSYWSIFQYAVTSCRANDRPGLEDRRTNGIPELSMVSLELCPRNSIGGLPCRKQAFLDGFWLLAGNGNKKKAALK